MTCTIENCETAFCCSLLLVARSARDAVGCGRDAVSIGAPGKLAELRKKESENRKTALEAATKRRPARCCGEEAKANSHSHTRSPTLALSRTQCRKGCENRHLVLLCCPVSLSPSLVPRLCFVFFLVLFLPAVSVCQLQFFFLALRFKLKYLLYLHSAQWAKEQ